MNTVDIFAVMFAFMFLMMMFEILFMFNPTKF